MFVAASERHLDFGPRRGDGNNPVRQIRRSALQDSFRRVAHSPMLGKLPPRSRDFGATQTETLRCFRSCRGRRRGGRSGRG